MLCRAIGGGPDWRADRSSAVQLPEPHHRPGPGHTAGQLLPDPRHRVDLDGRGRPAATPDLRRPARPAGTPDHQPGHDQPDPLAEPQLCAQAEPELLPERLRRAYCPAHHADRQLAARLGRGRRRCHLARSNLRHQLPGAVCRSRLAPDDPVGHLDHRLQPGAALLRATGQGTLGDLLRGALQIDGAHRRWLHQHHHLEAVRPHPVRAGVRQGSDHRADRKNPAGQPRGDQHGRGDHQHERPADRHHHRPGPVAVDTVVDLGGRHCPGHRPGDPHRQYVGLDHVGGQRHFREHRHGPGRPENHRPATGGDRPRWSRTA